MNRAASRAIADSIFLSALLLVIALSTAQGASGSQGAPSFNSAKEDRKLIVFDMDGTFLMTGFSDLGTNQTIFRDGKNQTEYHTAPFLFETITELRGEGSLPELKNQPVDIAIYTASSTGQQAIRQILDPINPTLNLFDLVKSRVIEGTKNLTLRQGLDPNQRAPGESIFKYYFKNLLKFTDGTFQTLMGRSYQQENIVMVEDINTVGPGQKDHLLMVDPVYIASQNFNPELIGTTATEEAGALKTEAPKSYDEWFQSTFRLAAIAPMVNEALRILRQQNELGLQKPESFQQILRRLSLEDRSRFIIQGLRLYGLKKFGSDVERFLKTRKERPVACQKTHSFKYLNSY